MKFVCAKRDGDGRKFFGDYTEQDRKDGKIPVWQKADGSIGEPARRWDQYFYALRTNEARAAFAELSRETTASPAMFLEACEKAWAEPGSAMETVARVREILK